MNFDLKDAWVIPFSAEEEKILSRFYAFLNEGKNAPLDVAYKAANIKMQKEYYPVRCFDVTYGAQWRATSIWEHEETYTVYESKTVYVDLDGGEHSYAGYDHVVNGVKYGTSSYGGKDSRPWTPVVKNIPKEKSKTVIDREEETYGRIGPYSTFQPVITFQKADESFAKWLLGFLKKEELVGYKPELLKDCIVKDLIETDEFAEKTALDQTDDIAARNCEAEIPGTRYRDLQCKVNILDSDMDIALIPFYRISYEYQGEKYECCLCGKKGGNFFYWKRPEDESLAASKKQMEDELAARKKDRMKMLGYMAAAVPIDILLTIILGSHSFIMILVVPFALVVVEAVLFLKLRNIHLTVNSINQAIENHEAWLQEKRKAVAAVVLNSSLTDDKKKAAVQNILERK